MPPLASAFCLKVQRAEAKTTESSGVTCTVAFFENSADASTAGWEWGIDSRKLIRHSR